MKLFMLIIVAQVDLKILDPNYTNLQYHLKLKYGKLHTQ